MRVQRLILLRGLLPLTTLMAAAVGLFSLALGPVQGAAALQPTPFVTPTPGPDGRIIYIFQEGDTLWTIAALTGISLEELMAINGIAPSDVDRIPVGYALQLGLGGPVVPTQAPGASPTDTPVPATATPLFGTGTICVLLFRDDNGDARWEEPEPPLAGGRVSIADVNGTVVGDRATDDTTELAPDDTPIGHCFADLPGGDYNVSAAVPVEHNPTTSMNTPVRLSPGDTKYVEFGAQPLGSAGGVGGGDSRSTLLGLVGLVLLLAAIGLGYYASRYGRKDRYSLR
ncbi:MAG: LysM domain-containing protein [Chloroflexota bacterium]